MDPCYHQKKILFDFLDAGDDVCNRVGGDQGEAEVVDGGQ